MRTTNFDRLATSAPLNADAAIARDGVSNDQWEARIPENYPRWAAPPPAEMQFAVSVLPVDLSGRTMGRLTVIRFHGPGKGGGRWLTRCTCGYYELRRGKAISNYSGANDRDHCCYECERVNILRKRAQRGHSAPGRLAADASRLDQLAASSRGRS